MDNERRTISIRLNEEDKLASPETHKESAAAEEREFEWILPERRDAKKIVELRKRHLQKKPRPVYDPPKKRPRLPVGRKKKTPPKMSKPTLTLQKKVVASAAFAIILGVLFGFSLLMVFAGDHVTTPTETEEKAAPVTATGPDLSLELDVVQSGAYETEESAKEFQEKLKDKGFPAAIFKGEKYFLFIGVSSSVEGQDALGNYFEGKGQDVYKKVWAIDGEAAVANEDVAKHMKEGGALLEDLTALDLTALSDNELTNKEVEKSVKAVQVWSDKGSELDEWDKGGGKELTDALKSAMKEIQTYSSEETVPSLWIAQQHLLDGMRSYQKLVESMK